MGQSSSRSQWPWLLWCKFSVGSALEYCRGPDTELVITDHHIQSWSHVTIWCRKSSFVIAENKQNRKAAHKGASYQAWSPELPTVRRETWLLKFVLSPSYACWDNLWHIHIHMNGLMSEWTNEWIFKILREHKKEEANGLALTQFNCRSLPSQDWPNSWAL